MKTICAWCKDLLVAGPSQPVSHGICENCAKGWGDDAPGFELGPVAEAEELLIAHHAAYRENPGLAVR